MRNKNVHNNHIIIKVLYKTTKKGSDKMKSSSGNYKKENKEKEMTSTFLEEKRRLREFVEMEHYLFAEEAKDWEEAILMSCKSLEADGTVESSYAHDILECVRQYGPYIVIMPNVAMPHSQEGAVGVNKTAIGFMKLNKPVSFDPEDPEKDAQLFLTLA